MPELLPGWKSGWEPPHLVMLLLRHDSHKRVCICLLIRPIFSRCQSASKTNKTAALAHDLRRAYPLHLPRLCRHGVIVAGIQLEQERKGAGSANQPKRHTHKQQQQQDVVVWESAQDRNTAHSASLYHDGA